MTALAAPVATRPDDLDVDTLHHSAHTPCQRSAPFVTLLCGITAGWDEKRPGVQASCVVCLDVKTCPVCGTRLRA